MTETLIQSHQIMKTIDAHMSTETAIIFLKTLIENQHNNSTFHFIMEQRDHNPFHYGTINIIMYIKTIWNRETLFIVKFF